MPLALEIIIRTLIAIAGLMLMTLILGVKHIAQLTTFDYIVGITIGSVAGALCVDDDIPILIGILSMAILILFAAFLTLLNRKTLFARRFLTGTPTLLIDEGKILYQGLKHVNFNVNDLLAELRTQGYFNVSDVQHAILENNGMLSVMPKVSKRPATVEDLNLKLPEEGLVANVIIDGKIIAGNLHCMNKTEEWLRSEISAQHLKIDNVLLATLNRSSDLSVYIKEDTTQRHTLFS